MGDTKKRNQSNTKSGVRKGRDLDKWKNNRPKAPEGCIRIIGGIHRGMTILYSGDRVTRPMKDNVREALFNLVGGYLEDTICFDLFAGTGAVGLEAISRKAQLAVLIERHVPTTKIIRQNIESLGVEDQAKICGSDTFFWSRQFFTKLQEQKSELESIDYEKLTSTPWSIFCCPPYDLYVSAWDKLKVMIETFQQTCPPNSLMVVESDSRFDPALLPKSDKLPESDQWDSRQYSPAVVSVWKKGQS